MAVLVTRPAPDNERSAETLRALGFEVLLAPMLVFETLPFQCDAGSARGVLLTSANAVRAIAAHPALPHLRARPVFAVGETTAIAARAAGFADVRAAGGDAVSLLAMVTDVVPAGEKPLLYLSADEISRDLGAALGEAGIAVERIPVYRMALRTELPADVQAAFARGAIEAVLHYSRRTALACLAAADRAGIGDFARAPPQVCLSEAIAAALREKGATRLVAARAPAEASLFEALTATLRSRL